MMPLNKQISRHSEFPVSQGTSSKLAFRWEGNYYYYFETEKHVGYILNIIL